MFKYLNLYKSTFQRVIAVSVVVLAAFQSSLLHAVDYYVSEESGLETNSGLSASSPLKYVRSAANKTKPGDTVYLLPGIYENLGATGPFDMLYVPNSGRPGEYITYSGIADADGNLPVIKSAAYTAITLQTKSYVIVENLEITAGDNDFLDVEGSLGGWAWDGRSGIGVQTDSHNIIVRNCFIHDLPGGGIGVSGSDVVLVEDNLVEHTSWGSTQGNSGISFYKMTEQANAQRFAEWPNHDVIIRNNVSRYNVNLKGTYTFDYALTDGNGIIIDDFKHTQGDESEAFEGSSLIIGNISYGNGAAGINVFQTNNAEVYHNSVFDNGQTPRMSATSPFEFNLAHQPIQVGGAQNVTVENNIFVRGDNSNSMVSLFWNVESSISITNNIFWNGNGSLSTSDVPAGNIIADPLFNSAIALTQSQTDLLATASWSESTPSALLRLPTVNAGFPVQDLALKPASPARDAATDLGYISAIGSGIDLGAIENSESSTGPVEPSIPDYDDVSSVTYVAPLYAGVSNSLTIDYAAQEDRDLLIILADGFNNWGWTAWVRHEVEAGQETATFELSIPANAPNHGNYKLEVLMVEKGGWNSATVASWATGNNTVNE